MLLARVFTVTTNHRFEPTSTCPMRVLAPICGHISGFLFQPRVSKLYVILSSLFLLVSLLLMANMLGLNPILT